MNQLQARYGAQIALLPFSGPEISSTLVRSRAAAGEDVASLVPAPVADYIRSRGLYLSSKSRPEILQILQSTLKPARYTHTLGVAETAKRLAERFGINPAKAELAALLHDCAKYLPLEEMREMVRENVADTDAAELRAESVLHAPAGMVRAREVFGVRDPEILSAIRRHTLGDAQMSALDALIYTADFIEPNRAPFPGLQEARQLVESDLWAATRKCAQLTNDYLLSQGKQPHPKSIAMLQSGMKA